MPDLGELDVTLARHGGWLHRHTPAIVAAALLASLALFLLHESMVYTVGPGERGVKWYRLFGGTDRKYTYGEGVQLVAPWDRLYIYDVRYQEMTTPVDVVMSGGLDVRFDVSVRFRPTVSGLPVLHVTYGPDYARKLIAQELELQVQEVAAGNHWEAIANRKAFTSAVQSFSDRVRGQLARENIQVDEIVVRRVTLPPVLAAAVQAKFEEQQRFELYEYRLRREEREAMRRRTEAAGYAAAAAILQPALTDRMLAWRDIEATLELAKSTNAKVVVVGRGVGNLPLVIDNTTTAAARAAGRPTP